jgi:hypothetical protein
MKAQHFQRCQVATPPDIVSLLWKLARATRIEPQFESVLDLGAGDARFARDAAACFGRYEGVEKDRDKFTGVRLPPRARVSEGDALRWERGGYSLGIGNPPYIRHHYLDDEWRRETLDRLEAESGIRLKRTANLYVLFLMQALLKTRDDGLVVQLVPFEWVTRPSASELRDFINSKGWRVQVYRFDADIFPRVLTTAAVVIVDKRRQAVRWEFGEIGRNGTIRRAPSPSGTRRNVLPYAERHSTIHAMRGLSPGGQKIFVLTEEERLHHGLQRRRDVVPCVTSLRRIGDELHTLDRASFDRTYVNSGARCWLIRSDRPERSPELQRYLRSVGTRWMQYSTCTGRADWAAYMPHQAPRLLVSSGFVRKSPKVLVNLVGAIAVGSVYGVHAKAGGLADPQYIAGRLRAYDFRQRVVHHSNELKKIEVRQLNAVLQRLAD